MLKYALGLNPLAPVTAVQLPSGSIQSYGGTNYLTLTVNRAADPPDISCIVEVTSKLSGGWISGAPNTVIVTNSPSQLVVRDNTPKPTATVRFI